MPRIEDEYLECAIYLYETRTDAENSEKEGATGFIVGVESPPQSRCRTSRSQMPMSSGMTLPLYASTHEKEASTCSKSRVSAGSPTR